MNGRVENDIRIFKTIEKQLLEYPTYISSWYFYLKANKQSAMTCRDYLYKIKNFLLFIDDEIKYVKLEDINEDIIVRYFISIQYKDDGTETSDSYKQGIWSCLNNFFDFLEGRNYINRNVLKTSRIKRPKNKDLERINQNRKLLTREDFLKILEAVDQGVGSKKAMGYQKKYKNRDKLIMLIFMITGMRKTALMEINIEDIDVNNKTLTIIDKGHKVHNYYLNDMAIDLYNKWIEDRYFLIGNIEGALFISKENKRMCGNSISKLVDKYSQAALGYHISPHKLRSGFISILYEEKHDVEYVRRVVGHSNVTTTQRYIVTNNDERKEAVDILGSLLNE